MKKKQKQEIFQFKIVLKESHPPIWRRFLVRSTITFEDFHFILQAVMGWEMSAPYEFIIKGKRVLMPEEGPYIFDSSGETLYAGETFLQDVLKRAGQKFKYIYDYEDNWVHELIFEKRLPEDESVTYPLCIDGANSCPPEKSGGIWGYYYRLDLMNSDGEEDDQWVRELREGMRGFDPSYFDLDDVNITLWAYFGIAPEIEEEAFDFLEAAEEPFTLDELFRYIQLPRTPESEKELKDLLSSCGWLVEDKGTYHPRESFLKDVSFRVTPTDFEIDRGILIMGHRILPFLPFNRQVEDVDLWYKNRMVDQKEMLLSAAELEFYFGLLDFGEIPALDSHKLPHGEYEYVVPAYDLQKFYREHKFKAGDSIIINPVDIRDCTFNIQYDSLENTVLHEESIKCWNELFIRALKRVLNRAVEKPFLEKQLTYGWYYMLGFMKRCEMELKPGGEWPMLIVNSRDINLSELDDGVKMLHFSDKVAVLLEHMDS